MQQKIDPVDLLLSKLHQCVSTRHTKTKTFSTHIIIKLFTEYFTNICERHVKKEYSQEHLVNCAFATSYKYYSDSEFTQYSKVCLILANRTLNKFISQITDNGKKTFTFYTLKYHKEFFSSFIHDIKPFIEFLERKTDPNFVFFEGFKNYFPQSFMIYNYSQSLLDSAFKKNKYQSSSTLPHLCSAFVLRQALETKFKRIVGLEAFDEKNQPPKLRHDFYYTFLKNNIDFFQFTSFNFRQIKKIYDWCSETIHTARSPFVWQMFFAHEICNPLFYSQSSPISGQWSIYDSILIKNVSNMQKKFRAYFDTEFMQKQSIPVQWYYIKTPIEAVLQDDYTSETIKVEEI